MTPNKSIQSLFLYGHIDVNFIELRKQATSTRSQSYIILYMHMQHVTFKSNYAYCDVAVWKPCEKKQKQQRKVQIHIVTFDHWHVEIPELQTFVHFIRHTRGTMLSAVDFYNRCLVALSTSLFVIFLKETMESKCHTWNIVLKCYFSYTCLFHFPPR